MAIVLTIVVLVGQMVGGSDAPAPDPPATTAAPAGALPAPWKPIGGARVERTVPPGFTATGPGDQGMALAEVGWCAPGKTYAATLRVRTSRPGTLLQVTLLEMAGGRRLAADTVGALLAGRGWQRVEVAHEGQRPGAALAVEVVLPRGSPRATVQVDGLEVEVTRSHQLRSGG